MRTRTPADSAFYLTVTLPCSFSGHCATALICILMCKFGPHSIGGTLSLASFQRTFGLTDETRTVLSSHIVSTFQGGCFFGALFVYPFLVRFGRKPCLLGAGVIFSIGAAIQTATNGNVVSFFSEQPKLAQTAS